MKNILIFFLVVFVVRVSIWTIPFVRDAFGYAYMGKQIANGAIVYKEVWDHKPPGIVFLNAFVYSISPESYLQTIRIIGILFAFLAAIFFYKLIQEFFTTNIAFLTTILFSIFSNVYMLTQGENMVEMYMSPILVLLYYVFIKAIQKRSLFFFFMSGILLGILFIFKQVGILPFGAIIVFLLLKRKNWFLRMLTIVAGITCVVCLTILYFYIQNATSDAYEAIFLYNVSYSGQGYSISSLSQSFFYFLQVILSTFLFWFLGVIGFLRQKRDEFFVLFIFFFCVGFMGTALGGQFAFTRNYFLLVLPSLGYFVAYGIQGIVELLQKDLFLKKVIFVVILFLLVPSVILQIQAILAGFYFRGFLKIEQRQAMYALGLPNFNFIQEEKKYYTIASYLQERVQKDQYILDFGAEPELYLLTRTHSPTRYFYNFPINGVFINDVKQEERRKIFIEEISNKKPLYVIVNKDEERHKPSYNDLNFSEFKKFVEKNYKLENIVENYFVFKLI